MKLNCPKELELRIYLEDTDKFGLVYHANYVKFFERGRIEWLREQNCSLERIYQAGYIMVVTNLTIDYLKPAYLDDELIISTQMIKCKMSLAIFSQQILSKDRTLIAKAQVKLVALGKNNNNLCNISKVFAIK